MFVYSPLRCSYFIFFFLSTHSQETENRELPGCNLVLVLVRMVGHLL